MMNIFAAAKNLFQDTSPRSLKLIPNLEKILSQKLIISQSVKLLLVAWNNSTPQPQTKGLLLKTD